ncbi:MAG: DUF4249 family protein [Gemmatimonadetes bacterium]|nr:DUF4249 family protein [Gemmatimonadota bacterium]
MNKPCLSALMLVMTMLAGCDDAVDVEDTDLVVVQAFLFAGEAVSDIRLTSTVPLGSDPDSAPGIDDAAVRLIKDGVIYVLEATGDSGRYVYPGSDLSVLDGDVFRLEVDYFGRVAWGETVVPAPPIDVAMDGDTLFAPTLGFGGGGRGGGGGGGGGFNTAGAQLAATWSNPAAMLHFVVVDGLEDDAEPIFPEQFTQRFGRFRFISEPTTDDFFIVNLLLLESLGRHQVRVYRVNQEYAELYENRTQDSRDLNEPPSNITNGLGVFSAFNSETVPFVVARSQ